MDTNMSGKLVVVTGATGGIGKEIARGVARLGGDVVVAARNPARGEAVRAELAAEAAGGEISTLPLDVSDLSSVRTFAAGINGRYQKLDVLVNNAGAWFTERRESPDGYELTFATNVLGPHLLTELLLDRLRAAPQGRVVNLISTITGKYDPTDLQYTRRKYGGYDAYAQSKQALTMLTVGLARRMSDSTVTANAAEPGFVRTRIQLQRQGHAGRDDQDVCADDGRDTGEGCRLPTVGGHRAGTRMASPARCSAAERKSPSGSVTRSRSRSSSRSASNSNARRPSGACRRADAGQEDPRLPNNR